MMEGIELADIVIPGSAGAASIWLFYRLFIRSDKRDRDLFRELKEQRDYWKSRAETLFEERKRQSRKLAEYRRRYGPIDDDEQT